MAELLHAVFSIVPYCQYDRTVISYCYLLIAQPKNRKSKRMSLQIMQLKYIILWVAYNHYKCSATSEWVRSTSVATVKLLLRWRWRLFARSMYDRVSLSCSTAMDIADLSVGTHRVCCLVWRWTWIYNDC